MTRALVLTLLALTVLATPHAWAELPAELPADLVWETNDTDPEFADPRAQRGGTFRTFMLSFPLTLRRVGPDSNGAFAGILRPNQMGLVVFHPNTRKPMPSLATHWAFDPNGRTVYYRLDENARWSDGVPVTAADYEFTLEFMRSKEIVAPWYNNYYTEQILDVKAYGDHVVGVEGYTAKPREEVLYNYGIGLVARHFHTLDENWVRDYNWQIEPNTGPYQISRVEKGKFIELERKDDWWANDRRYYRHRFNPKTIRVSVIRDMDSAYQYFLKGELDTFGLTLPAYWHEKAQGRPFDRGYIRKYWHYNDLPVPSAGLTLNTNDPLLADKRVREALAHSLNFDRVIKTILRNDYERMHLFNEGFGDYDHPTIRAREFDLRRASQLLKEAGWGQRGRDGIRVKDGQRLSVRVTYGAPHHTDRLVILREEAKKAGIDIVPQLMDSAGSFKQMLEKKHQVAWMAWNSQGLSPRYWEFFHSVNASKTQTNNFSAYGEPETDALIEAYRAETSREKRIELALQLEQIVHDSAVYIPRTKAPYTRSAGWAWLQVPEGVATRSSGGIFNPFETSAGAFSAGGLFWIDQGMAAEIESARAAGRSLPADIVINEPYRK